MKKIVIVIAVIFTLVSCSQNEQNIETENSIYGTWQLIKNTGNNVGSFPIGWQKISNGHTITFKENGSYIPSVTPLICDEIKSSIFLLSNESDINLIETQITCNNTNTVFKSINSYTFKNNGYLILVPIDPGCDEGCAFMYKKI